MADKLRLITYNIRKGKGANGREKLVLDDISRALSNVSADILLCQEVFHSEKNEVSQSAFLAEVLRLDSFYGANKFRSVGHHGNTTFTNLTVNSVENHDISTNRMERRGALYVRAQFNGRSLHIFNVHLGLNKRQRIVQVRKLAQLLSNKCRETDPIVIAGDFNDWNGRLERVLVEELGFNNAFNDIELKCPPTWHARRPIFNLDRIYLKNLAVTQVECLSGAPWPRLSDHLPLLAEIS
jgi:endonuclease/exonuclease/phosphatase family metal-dependent hydrolase